MAKEERDIQNAILDFLELKGFIAFKHSTGLHKGYKGGYIATKKKDNGISDIIAISPQGTFCAFEVKKTGGKSSEAQEAFVRDVVKRGGIAGIVYSVQDVVDLISA